MKVIVDATVVVMAATLGAIVWTSGPEDIRALAGAQDTKPSLVARAV